MMMTITEKIANLKGYLEGVQLDENKAETKVIAKIVDILEDMALEIEEMEEQVDTLNDYAEELDEDLGDVEDKIDSAYKDFDKAVTENNKDAAKEVSNALLILIKERNAKCKALR